MHLKNHSNEYIEALDRGVFDDIPKSVFAAIAVSYLVNHGVEFSDVTQEILNEWQTLYDNKVVPQKPKVRPTTNAADRAKTAAYFEDENVPTAAGHGYGY